LPVFNFGSEENSPEPDPVPLIGVSDCALDLYRHSADLNQNQYQCCNPTLVFTGVDPEFAPKVIGSTVAVVLSDKDANAFYVSTDTNALTHIRDYMADVFQEAVAYGAQLLGPSKKSAESGEALGLRQAAQGATLVTIVSLVGSGIQDLLQMASDLVSGGAEVVFTPNTEFAEVRLTAPEITALSNLWMSSGISKLSLIENLAAAGLTGGRTAEEELFQIESETPDGSGSPDGDVGDVVDEDVPE
jgi:Domain of unknown function (DUF4055)